MPSGGTPGAGGVAEVLANPLIETCTSSLGGMGGMLSQGRSDGHLVIEDFEDEDEMVWTNGISGQWESHSDFTEEALQSPLGGRHAPDSDWADPVGDVATFGPGRDGGSAAHFTGRGFKLWGSGQALYFAIDETGDECIYDASAFDGLTFWAKGSVELEYPNETDKWPKDFERGRLKIHVVERDVVPNEIGGGCNQEKYDCWDSHRARIELTDCWQKFVIPFEDLGRDGYSKTNPGELDLAELYQLVFEVSEYQEYDVWLDDIEFFVGDTPEPVTCVE